MTMMIGVSGNTNFHTAILTITPSVSNIVIAFEDNAGPANVGIIFGYTGSGSPLAPHSTVIVKQHTTSILAIFNMGDDDAGSPIGSAAVDHTGEWTTVTDAGLLGSPQGSLWEVACTSEDSGTPGTWDTEAAAVGAYIPLSTRDAKWAMDRVGGKGRVAGTDSIVATFRIREIADTANFTEFTVDVKCIQI